MRLKRVLNILFCALVFSAGAAEQKTADQLLDKARSGDVSSQLRLADEYFFGRSKRKINLHLAAYWFRQAAEKENARAQFNYGVCCLKGWGVPASPQTGYLWISRAAEKNLEQAVVMQCELLFRGLDAELDSDRRFPPMSADPEKALSRLTGLYEKGSVPAAKTLARLLLSDSQYRNKCAFQLRKCAQFAAGKSPHDVECVLMYATVLQNGIGGDGDMKKAVSLLHSIADFSPEAMARLADVYEYGLTGTADPAKALDFCRRAAKNGSPRAMHSLGVRHLEANMVEHSPQKAFKLFEESWKAGYPAGASSLGKCHLNAIGTQKDENKAFELFLQGATAGDPESQYQLGLCFLNAIGTARDTAGAVHWFKAAASAGSADAMRELGIALIRGVGTKQNIQYGREMLEEAVKRGDVRAMEFLRGELSK